MNNKDTGFLGENITAEYLTQNGFEIFTGIGAINILKLILSQLKMVYFISLKLKPEQIINLVFPSKPSLQKKCSF